MKGLVGYVRILDFTLILSKMRNHWKVLKSDVMIMLLGKEQLVGALEREASDDGSRGRSGGSHDNPVKG